MSRPLSSTIQDVSHRTTVLPHINADPDAAIKSLVNAVLPDKKSGRRKKTQQQDMGSSSRGVSPSSQSRPGTTTARVSPPKKMAAPRLPAPPQSEKKKSCVVSSASTEIIDSLYGNSDNFDFPLHHFLYRKPKGVAVEKRRHQSRNPAPGCSGENVDDDDDDDDDGDQHEKGGKRGGGSNSEDEDQEESEENYDELSSLMKTERQLRGDQAVLAALKDLHGGAHLPAFRFYLHSKEDQILFPSADASLAAALANSKHDFISDVDLAGLCSPRRATPRRKIKPVVIQERMRHRTHTKTWAAKGDQQGCGEMSAGALQLHSTLRGGGGGGGGGAGRSSPPLRAKSPPAATSSMKQRAAEARVNTNLASLLPPPDHNPASTKRREDLVQSNCFASADERTNHLSNWPKRPHPPKPQWCYVEEPRSLVVSAKDRRLKALREKKNDDDKSKLSNLGPVIEAAGKRALEEGARWFKEREKNETMAIEKQERRKAAQKRKAERLVREVRAMLLAGRKSVL